MGGVKHMAPPLTWLSEGPEQLLTPPPLTTWQLDQCVTLTVSGQTSTNPAELLNASPKVKQNFSRIWSCELIVCAVFSSDRFYYATFSQVWCDFSGYLCGRSPALLHNRLNIWYVIIQAYYSSIFNLYRWQNIHWDVDLAHDSTHQW